MMYLALKHLHITCVVLSGAGFLVRGLLRLADSPLLARRALRIAPHVVDTVLLGSAIGLALISMQYPLSQDWLTAKVVGLLFYIGVGTMALKRARTPGSRAFFFVAALASFAYIVSVALAHHPLGFLLYFLR